MHESIRNVEPDSVDPAGIDLARALSRPLPGAAAWKGMLPPFRGGDEFMVHHARKPEREASVLILLHPAGGSLAFPVLERAAHLRHHAGQLALPGGALERGETPGDAALRETLEETGVEVPRSALLGALSDIPAVPSGYLVHPFVARVPSVPAWRLQESEAAALYDIALGDLLDPATAGHFRMRHGGADFDVPCFRFGRHVVWGVTAMILAEFRMALLDEDGAALGPRTR